METRELKWFFFSRFFFYRSLSQVGMLRGFHSEKGGLVARVQERGFPNPLSIPNRAKSLSFHDRNQAQKTELTTFILVLAALLAVIETVFSQ